MTYNDSFCAVVVFLLLQRKENFLCIHYPFNCISISKSAGPKPRPSPQLLLQWKRRFLCKRMCSSATCPKLMKTQHTAFHVAAISGGFGACRVQRFSHSFTGNPKIFSCWCMPRYSVYMHLQHRLRSG